MYSLKLAQLVHEYVEAEVHEIYRDMRSFGKGYEEFYNRTAKQGVNLYHGKVSSVEQKGQQAAGQMERGLPRSAGPRGWWIWWCCRPASKPQADTGTGGGAPSGSAAARTASSSSGIPSWPRSRPASEGIYLAGACQSPKDIPDSVAQAGAAAAAAALSLIDQGTIALDPSIAEVNLLRCAGCGQCAAACPYLAIEIAGRSGRRQGERLPVQGLRHLRGSLSEQSHDADPL